MRVVLLFALLLTSLWTQAQKPWDIDSLRMRVRTAWHPAIRISALNLLSYSYLFTNTDTAEHYAFKAMALAEEVGDKIGIANTCGSMGNLKARTGVNDEAIMYLDCAKEVYSEREDDLRLANNSIMRANVFTNEARWQEALDAMQQALNIYVERNDKISTGGTLSNIGNIYESIGNYELALKAFMTSMKHWENVGVSEFVAMSLNQIGRTYLNLRDYETALKYILKARDMAIEGHYFESDHYLRNNMAIAFQGLGRTDTAKVLFWNSIRYRTDGNLREKMFNPMIGLGRLYTNSAKYDSARYYLDSALALATRLNAPVGQVKALVNLGELYRVMEDYEPAVANYREALRMARKFKILAEIPVIYESFAQIEKARGNTEGFYHWFRKHQDSRDSLINITRVMQLGRIEAEAGIERVMDRMEIVEKDAEVKALENARIRDQQRSQLIIMLGALAFLLIIAYLLYNRYKQRQQAMIERTLAEQQKLRFHAVLDALETDRKRIATELHDNIGQLLLAARLNISAVDSDTDSARLLGNSLDLIDGAFQSARTIAHDMMPGALMELGLVPAVRDLVQKLNDASELEILVETDGFDERIDEKAEVILFRIIQELVSNIIKHARADQAQIRLRRDAEGILLTVSDNGVGMHKLPGGDEEGIGWKNIRSRAALLDGEVRLQSQPGQGMTVYVRIPAVFATSGATSGAAGGAGSSGKIQGVA